MANPHQLEATLMPNETSIPKDVVDAVTWQTNFREKFSGADRTERLLFTGILTLKYQENPDLDPLKVVEEFQRLRADYDRRVNKGQDKGYVALKSKDEIIRIGLDVASQLPRGEFIGVIKRAYEYTIDKYAFPKLDEATQVTAAQRRFEDWEDIRKREASILKDSIDLAKTNDKFATAFDTLFGPELNASIKDVTASTIIARNPTIKIPPRIKNNIGQDGTVLIALQELQDMSRAEFKNISGSLEDIRSTVKSIDQKQDRLIEYMQDQVKRQEAQKLAADKQAEHQLKLDAANSSLFVVSTLAGFIDPQTGKYISVVGSSFIHFGESVNGWMGAVAGLSALQAIGSLSTVVMTGNILGAVMNIISLFEEAGPSPDQIILDSIRDLRNEIGTLRQEMSARVRALIKSTACLERPTPQCRIVSIGSTFNCGGCRVVYRRSRSHWSMLSRRLVGSSVILMNS